MRFGVRQDVGGQADRAVWRDGRSLLETHDSANRQGFCGGPTGYFPMLKRCCRQDSVWAGLLQGTAGVFPEILLCKRLEAVVHTIG
jgi:hypothetical protein